MSSSRDTRARTAPVHRRRRLGGVPRGEQLRHVERVASGRGVQLVGVLAGERGHRVARQRQELEQHRRRRAGSRRAPRGGGDRAAPRRPGRSPRAAAGSVPIRRPSTVIESSVASSAQCTSSSASTVGRGGRSSSAISRSWMSCGAASAASASSSAAETLPARSRNGPSGRGIERSSQVPNSTRASPSRSSRNRLTSEVLPIPGSPLMHTIRPSPRAAAALASTSAANASSRSSSSTPTVDT